MAGNIAGHFCYLGFAINSNYTLTVATGTKKSNR